jgi:hypothetical protein
MDPNQRTAGDPRSPNANALPNPDRLPDDMDLDADLDRENEDDDRADERERREAESEAAIQRPPADS